MNNWPIQQHQYNWNNENDFLNYLRRKLPVIAGGGGGGTWGSITGTITAQTDLINYIAAHGGSQTLQQVTDIGNTTTDGIIFNGTNIPLIINQPTASTFNYLQVVFPSVAPEPSMAYQMQIAPNANGDGTYDLVRIEGWNIDSTYNNTQPSWTTRMEYQYTGDIYEYHIQWESADQTRAYRLMSHTLVDHGGADSNLIFFEGALEFRPLGSSTYFSAIGTAANAARFELAYNTINPHLEAFDDGTPSTRALKIFNQAGTAYLYVTQFTRMDFSLNSAHINFSIQPVNAQDTLLVIDQNTSTNVLWVEAPGGLGIVSNSNTGILNFGGSTSSIYAVIKMDAGAGELSHEVPAHASWSHTFYMSSNKVFTITDANNTGFSEAFASTSNSVGLAVVFAKNDLNQSAQLGIKSSAYAFGADGAWVVGGGSLYCTAAQGLSIISTDATNGIITFSTGSNVEIARFNLAGTLALKSHGASGAQLNLATTAGTPPTSPVDGDMWYDGTNVKFRVSGTTKTFTLT